MLDSLAGGSGRRHLAAYLVKQRAVRADEALAAALAEVGTVRTYSPGGVVIDQEGDGDSVYFLLLGAVEVLVNGRIAARRGAGETVGEMAAIDPRALRAATVRAVEPTVALCVGESQLGKVGQRFPALWRNFAAELAERLRQSNRQYRSPNPRPHVLVLAAHPDHFLAIEAGLRPTGAHVLAWAPGTSEEQDVDRLADADFAVAVMAPEGGSEARNLDYWLGLARGTLGRGRVILVTPEAGRGGARPGATIVAYDPVLALVAPAEALAAAVESIGSSIAEVGPR